MMVGMVMQGRAVSGTDIGLIRGLPAEHPAWGRTRLSEELCRRWDWRNAQGRPKDMAARTLLLEVTEHQGEVKTCACGRVNRFAFPPEAAAPVSRMVPV